ncbi:MAG: BACON domain-containing protein, partial [Alistipes sp.]|nr:BACON domain-containing protein [Alistipes sp.]
MKKILILIAMAIGVVACDTDKPTPDEPNTSTPVLTLTSEGSVWFEATGGEGVINYTLENPAKDVELKASSSVEWITDITIGDSITYLVAQSDIEEERRGIITVEYGKESFSVSIMQHAMFNVDVTFEAESLNGSSYYGKVESADSYHYYLMLSTNGVNQSGNLYPDTSYYIFDIYAATGAENGVATLPIGEYTFGAEGVAGSIYNGYSKFIETSQSGNSSTLFTDVRLIVSQEAIEAYITLDNGEKHYVTYSGNLAIDPYKAENTNGYSTLCRDYSFDISGGLFVGAYVGNMYYSSADTCQVFLFEELDLETGEEFGDEFQLDLQLPRGNKDICGTYT